MPCNRPRHAFLRRLALLILLLLTLLACRLPYEFGRQVAGVVFTETPVFPTPTATLTPEAYPGVSVTDAPPTETPVVEPGAYPAGPYPQLPGGPSPSDPANLDPGAEVQPGSGQTTPYPGDPPLETGTPVELQAQPVTVVPTLTPFLTATPTATSTPTPTNTPLPPPPWIAAPLKETDPRTVSLASGSVQLVEFFAYWSGSSQAMAPIVQGVEAEYAPRVKFAYLDIDNPASRPLMDTLDFESEPHFFVLAPDGKVVKELIGPVTLAELRGAIEEALSR